MSSRTVWCGYHNDIGELWAIRVPLYQVEEEGSVWQLASTLDPVPYRLRASVTPRRVYGVDDLGHIAYRHEENSQTDRMSGFVTTFQNKDRNGALVTYTITGRVGERARVAR